MTERLRNKCDLFLRNRNIVSKKFKFEKDMMSIAAGLIFTGADKETDIERMNAVKFSISIQDFFQNTEML